MANNDGAILRAAMGGPSWRPRYGGGGGDRLIDLALYRGQQQAEARQEQGQIWGNAAQNIGQQISGALKEHAEKQEQSKRDAAWATYVKGGTWAGNPAEAASTAFKIGGPELGKTWLAGLAGASQLAGPKADPKADEQAVIALHRAMKSVDEPTRAELWPQAVALVNRKFPKVALSSEYTPQEWAKADALMAGGQEPPKLEKGSPGDVFFDPATHQQAFAVPQAPKEPKSYEVTVPGPGGRPIKRLASAEEMAGGVPVYQEPHAPREHKEPSRMWVIRDGAPIRVSESEYRPGDLPASTREQGRPVTSGDADKVAELNTSLSDVSTLRKTLGGNKSTGVAAKLGAGLWNPITEFTGIGTEAKQKQATIDRVKQVIGKALEDGVLRKEDEAKYEKILPTIGDPPEVVTSKLDGLEQAILKKRQFKLDAMGDAGYDTGRFQSRQGQGGGPHRIDSDADYDALPAGAEFVGPDGVRRRKP